MKRKFGMSYQELPAMLMAVNHATQLTADYRDILCQKQIYTRSRIMFLHPRPAFLISFAPSYHHQDKKAKRAVLTSSLKALLLLSFPKMPLKTINSRTTFPNTTEICMRDQKKQTPKDTFPPKILREKMFCLQGLASDLSSPSNPSCYLIQPSECRIVPEFPWRHGKMGTVMPTNIKARQGKNKIKESQKQVYTFANKLITTRKICPNPAQRSEILLECNSFRDLQPTQPSFQEKFAIEIYISNKFQQSS